MQQLLPFTSSKRASVVG